MVDIQIALGAAHIKRIDRASTRRIRKMTNYAVSKPCIELRRLGLYPITCVDDLTIHSIGRWIIPFSRCIARSAKREGISIVGGEMAQMADIYTPNYAGIVVSVVGVKLP